MNLVSRPGHFDIEIFYVHPHALRMAVQYVNRRRNRLPHTRDQQFTSHVGQAVSPASEFFRSLLRMMILNRHA